MKIKIGFSLFLLLALLISGTAHLHAQRKININDKTKTISRTKSAIENTQLPSQFLEGVEKYREFYPNPQLKSGASAIQPGDEIIFEMGVGAQNIYTGIVTAAAEYIPGITGITAKIQGYDFAYGYMAISDKGIEMSVNIPETNQEYSVRRMENSFYLLKYSPEYIKQQNASFKCGTPDIQPDEIPQEETMGEMVKAEPRTQPKKTKSSSPLIRSMTWKKKSLSG